MIDYWEEEVQRIVTESRDSADIPERWNALCQELVIMGIDDLETRMTHRYEQALKRYQAEGYYTE